MFRSIANVKDWAILQGKEFFNKEKLNPYQGIVKKKIQQKHGKYFYLRDLYKQYDMDIWKQAKKETKNKKKAALEHEQDLMQVRLLDDWHQNTVILAQE